MNKKLGIHLIFLIHKKQEK